jgi:7,8-dihydro-6-hydroxymethylpterin dimethyltransferase
MESVRRQIELGTATSLSFDTAHIGHARCNRYAMTLVINGRVYDLLDDHSLFDEILERTASLQFDRQHPVAAVRTLLTGVLSIRQLTRRGVVWLARKLWRAKSDLVAARGRANKLSF